MSALLARPRAALALACALPFALSCSPAHAQATPVAAAAAAAVDPERIVVTGAREPVAAGRLAGDLVVIDAEQIAASTADSVEDLLRREAGLQLSRNGGPGAAAALLIRGAGSGNTLVLVDGVRIGSATLGQVEFEGLSLGMIDRIEILRGPGSSLYGADGAGGVVQIFTRRGDGKTRFGAGLAAGQYGAVEAVVNASGRVGDFDLAGSLSHEQLEGVSALRPNDRFGNYNPDRDGSRRTTAQAQLGWRPVEGQRIGLSVVSTKLNSQYDGSEYPPPDFEQDNTPDFRNKLDNQLAALEYRADWNADWSTTLRASTQEDDLHSGGNQIDRYRTRRQQLDAQATWRVDGAQRVTFAYEGLKEKGSSSAFAADVETDNNALIVAWLGQLGPVNAQADIRHDDNSDYGQVTTGRLGGKLKLDETWRLRALAGTSFRAPSFNDRYYPGYGVPGIKPERGVSMELGVDGRWSDVEVSATAWRNRTRNLIVYESDRTLCPEDPAYDFGCAANVGRARMQGLTLSGGWHSGGWELRGVADFIDAKDAESGARLNRRAAHQFSLAADYTLGDWRFGAAVLQVGARPDGSNFELPEETTLDLKVRWQFAPRWSLEAKVVNATDEDLQPVRDYQGLGRQAWIGVRYAFDGS